MSVILIRRLLFTQSVASDRSLRATAELSRLDTRRMPFYRFQIQSRLTTETILVRIRALVRESPGFWQSVRESLGRRPDDSPPFIGRVEGNRFRMRRDIRYRNSFLPQVHGSVVPNPVGANVKVTMYLHPLVVGFMLFWLGTVGLGALVGFTNQRESMGPALIPAGMFLFGIGLVVGGFYPEAYKARRLLEQGIRNGV
jgi:hypothetical protein